MRRVVCVFFSAMLLALPGMATIVCPGNGTYQDLINSNAAGGCTIAVAASAGGGLLTFSNFTFTATGAGTPSAAQMGYLLDNPGVSIGAGQSIYGFEFNPGLAVNGTSLSPNAIEDILLTYKVVVTGRTITSVHLLENAGVTGSGVAQVVENLTFCIGSDPDPTLGTCRFFGANPLMVTTAADPPGVHNDRLNLLNWTSITVSKDINVSSNGVGGTATISQVRDALDLNAVPEPATYGFVGVGLIALGYVSRRRKA